MKRYTADILSEITGLTLTGATLDVLVSGTETRVMLYATDDDSGATVPQPVPNGTAFYVPDGRYDLRARIGAKVRTVPEVDMYDGAEQNRRLEAVENGEPGALGSLRADLLSGTGAGRVKFLAGVGATAEAVADTLGRTVWAEIWGCKAGNSNAANLAGLKRAVAAVPDGGVLVVNAATIDTSGGLSSAVVVNRPMTVRLQGRIQASHGAVGENPPVLFHVTSPGVVIEGGTLAGPGTVDDVNIADDTTFPSLLLVEADRFRCIGVTFEQAPKIGALLINASFAMFIGCTFRGGPVTYNTTLNPSHTAYFGIRATGGGRHIILGCNAVKGGDGGRVITMFFAGGSSGGSDYNIVQGCFADVHEKLSYIFGHHNHVADCHVVDALHTDVFRFIGSYNRLSDCTGHNVRGGFQFFNGHNNQAVDCQFTDVQQSGGNIAYYDTGSDYVDGFDDCKIAGCTFTAGGGPPGDLQDGVIFSIDKMIGGVRSAHPTIRGLEITDCEISGFGVNIGKAALRVEIVGGNYIEDATLSSNTIADAARGILMSGVRNSDIDDNGFRRIASYPIAQNNSGPNGFEGNSGLDCAIKGIGGFVQGVDEGHGNRWSTKPLRGTFTLSTSAATTIVTHGGIALNANDGSLNVWPIGTAAQTFVFNNGPAAPFLVRDGQGQPTGDFGVSFITGNVAPAGCVFGYQIVGQ